MGGAELHDFVETVDADLIVMKVNELRLVVSLVSDDDYVSDVGAPGQHRPELRKEGGGGDHHPDLRLVEAVTYGVVPQVRVDRAHNDALGEGAQGGQDPLCSGLRKYRNRSAGVLSKMPQSATKVGRDLISLTIVHPLVRAKVEFLKNLPIKLTFLLHPEYLPCSEAEFIIILDHGVLPDLVECVHVTIKDQVTKDFVVRRCFFDHANVLSRLRHRIPILAVCYFLPGKVRILTQ